MDTQRISEVNTMREAYLLKKGESKPSLYDDVEEC